MLKCVRTTADVADDFYRAMNNNASVATMATIEIFFFCTYILYCCAHALA